MAVADVEHADGRRVEVGLGGFATLDGHGRVGEHDAAGEEFVLMGAAGMRQQEGGSVHRGGSSGASARTAMPVATLTGV